MKKTDTTSTDPKNKMVSLENLEKYNKQPQERTSQAREKRAPPSDDEDAHTYILSSEGDNQATPQGKKKPKTSDGTFIPLKDRNLSEQEVQQQMAKQAIGKDEQTIKGNISDQAMAYAIENNLQPIKIECSPPLGNRDLAKKVVINFFKQITKDFRNEYPRNMQPLGFHHWWTDNNGSKLFGVINDIDLYIYLCEAKHYPTQIENVRLKPEPPNRLPPQNTIVIKFVHNELGKNEVEEELKGRLPSIFAIDDMMGTMRTTSRHIRIQFWKKEDYVKILNDGKIGLQGQVFEVEEYLPPPKILICSKCNTPGHVKRTCQSTIEICRRCGKNRNDGNKHNECTINCHHCGGNHTAIDYKCPSIIKFRQELLLKLKDNRSKLPPNLKLFIPVDCRLNGDRNRYLTSSNELEKQMHGPHKPPKINPWRINNLVNEQSSIKNDLDQTIDSLANELTEFKKNFEIEQEKIKQTYTAQMKEFKQGWTIMQQQIQAQNQYILLYINDDERQRIGNYTSYVNNKYNYR